MRQIKIKENVKEIIINQSVSSHNQNARNRIKMRGRDTKIKGINRKRTNLEASQSLYSASQEPDQLGVQVVEIMHIKVCSFVQCMTSNGDKCINYVCTSCPAPRSSIPID